jgi:hypothetical protein
MFKSRYLLSDVARILNRSEVSLMREAKLGHLHAHPIGSSRTTAGSSELYSVTLSDLVRYMGKDEAYNAFGPNQYRKRAAVEPEQPVKKEPMQAKYKKCRICGRLKQISAFPREAGLTHWLAAECLSCLDKQHR